MAKKGSPAGRDTNTQMGHVDAVKSSASIAHSTGSRCGHTSKSDGHSSYAYQADWGDTVAETEVKFCTGVSQQSNADLIIEVVDEDDVQVPVSGAPPSTNKDPLLYRM